MVLAFHIYLSYAGNLGKLLTLAGCDQKVAPPSRTVNLTLEYNACSLLAAPSAACEAVPVQAFRCGLIREGQSHWQDGAFFMSATHLELAAASHGSLDPHCSCYLLEKMPVELDHVLFRK